MDDSGLGEARRFIDSGWRITIPKSIRDRLNWQRGTSVCIWYDGSAIRIRTAGTCPSCPDASRLGALGKVVIPPRVRAEAHLYRGQIMVISITGSEVVIRPGRSQVRCQACGSELDVRGALPNVYLCRRCREALAQAIRRELFREQSW